MALSRVALHGDFGQQTVAQIDGLAADDVGLLRGSRACHFFVGVEVFEVYFELNALSDVYLAFVIIVGLYVIVTAAGSQHEQQCSA